MNLTGGNRNHSPSAFASRLNVPGENMLPNCIGYTFVQVRFTSTAFEYSYLQNP